MRINKYLAECGVCSRRKADELVKQGRVSVNKKVVKEVGTDIGDKDVVFVDGKKVVKVTHYDYLMFNKPKGCVTTLNDERDNKSGRPKKEVDDGAKIGSKPTKQTDIQPDVDVKKKPRKTVIDYIGGDFRDKRLFPIGRLDYDSEGLLLLTNDGNMTYKLTHPSSEIPKTYIVKIEGDISESDLAILRKGVTVDGVKFGRCKVKVTGVEKRKSAQDAKSGGKKSKLQEYELDLEALEALEEEPVTVANTLTRLEVIIFEGKNREIRRMFEAVEKNVVFLKRVAIGDLRLGGVSRGCYRELNEMEIAYLQKLCEKIARE